MALLQKVKKFLKIGEDSTDNPESVKKRRLSEQLAKEKEQRKKWEEQRYQELHSKPQKKNVRDEPIHQFNDTPSLEEQNRLADIRAEEKRQKVENQKNVEIRAEEERVRAGEQRKLAEIHLEEERLRAEEQRLAEIRAEEERVKAKERQRLAEIRAEERRIKEIEWLKKIHVLSLSTSDHREYLIECQSFRHEFGKNVHCDVCGKSEEVNFELFVVRKQTYCKNCIPPDFHRERERKKIAGRHGSSRDYIEK